jgi:hypothetical protein
VTTRPSAIENLPTIVGDVIASASGAELRHDPVLPRTGGPSGNARLTAWAGLLLLGPLVVFLGLAVLGSGLALIPLGQSSFSPMFTIAGQSIDRLTLHKLCFVLWFVATGAHVLARTVPALQLVAPKRRPRRRVPGATLRLIVVSTTLVASIVTGVIVMNLSSNWTSGQVHHFDVEH